MSLDSTVIIVLFRFRVGSFILLFIYYFICFPHFIYHLFIFSLLYICSIACVLSKKKKEWHFLRWVRGTHKIIVIKKVKIKIKVNKVLLQRTRGTHLIKNQRYATVASSSSFLFFVFFTKAKKRKERMLKRKYEIIKKYCSLKWKVRNNNYFIEVTGVKLSW